MDNLVAVFHALVEEKRKLADKIRALADRRENWTDDEKRYWFIINSRFDSLAVETNRIKEIWKKEKNA